MVQFCLYDMTFSFINCHLSAKAENVDARLKMAYDLLRRNPCANEKDKIEPDSTSDFNFFMGDFNMRLNLAFEDFEKTR